MKQGTSLLIGTSQGQLWPIYFEHLNKNQKAEK